MEPSPATSFPFSETLSWELTTYVLPLDPMPVGIEGEAESVAERLFRPLTTSKTRPYQEPY